MPIVSVVVPAYNVAPYLPHCLDSLLAQTFTDFEILLVDDGSVDGTPEICDAYAQKDARIRVLHKKNGGLSAARNDAIAMAQGKYIMCLDGDDFVLPHWIETMEKAITATGADMVKSGFLRVQEPQRDFSLPKTDAQIQGKISQTHLVNETLTGKQLLVKLADNPVYNMSCMQIEKTDLMKKHPYPVGRLCEDMAQLMELCAELHKVVCIDAADYCWVMRGGSITNAGSLQLGVDNMKNYHRLCELLLAQGENEAAGAAAAMATVQLFYGPLSAKYVCNEKTAVLGRDTWLFLRQNAHRLRFAKKLPPLVRAQMYVYRFSPMLYKNIMRHRKGA